MVGSEKLAVHQVMSSRGLPTCVYLYLYFHLYFVFSSEWSGLQKLAVQGVMSSQGLATCGQSLWALGALMPLIAAH